MLLKVAIFLCITFGSYYFWTWKKLWNVFGRPNVGWKDVFVTYSFKKPYRESSFNHETQMEQKIHFLIGLCGKNLYLCCFINSEPPQSDVSLGRRENRGINRMNSKRVWTDFKGPFRQPTARTLLFPSFQISLDSCCFCKSREGECADQEIPSLGLSRKSLILLLCDISASQYCYYGVIFK